MSEYEHFLESQLTTEVFGELFFAKETTVSGIFSKILRYRNADGSPNPFMEDFEQNVWEHIAACIEMVDHLQDEYPLLGDFFDLAFIKSLIWIHEIDELVTGDRAHLSGELIIDMKNWESAFHPCVDKEADWYLLAWLDAFLIIIGMNDANSREKWTGYLTEMERPTECTDPNILLAKTIDRTEGNLTVARFGNNLVEYEKELKIIFMAYSGPVFRQLLKYVYPENPQAAQIIVNEMLIKVRDEFAQNGLYNLPIEVCVPSELREAFLGWSAPFSKPFTT